MRLSRLSIPLIGGANRLAPPRRSPAYRRGSYVWLVLLIVAAIAGVLFFGGF